MMTPQLTKSERRIVDTIRQAKRKRKTTTLVIRIVDGVIQVLEAYPQWAIDMRQDSP